MKMDSLSNLPNSLTTQYSELMQNCVRPISDGSNLSFKSKVINRKRYWYLYISVGSTRREHYLGEETTVLLDRIEDEKERLLAMKLGVLHGGSSHIRQWCLPADNF